MKYHSNRKQFPNKKFIFFSKKFGEDVGILPSKHRKSNMFARWKKDSTCREGGIWTSRKFENMRSLERQLGKGPQGLRGRFMCLLNSSRQNAKERKYKPIKESADKLILIWLSQNNKCAACFGFLSLKDAYGDHDHKTGNFRGFLHKNCNLILGFCGDRPQVLLLLSDYLERK